MKNYTFLFTNSKELDITKHSEVEKFILDNDIKVIINCAAYTAVDKAESNEEVAERVNHLAVANIAELSKLNDIKFIDINLWSFN